MDTRDLAKIDLNLLIFLDILLEERSVTAAAQKLHRSQSATSHALNRLRQIFGDPLLVRDGWTMKRTPYAEHIVPLLKRLLSDLKVLMTEPQSFVPELSQRVYRLAVPGIFAPLIQGLIQQFSLVAPNATLEIIKSDKEGFNALLNGRCDIMIAPPVPKFKEVLKSHPIGALHFGVFARSGHPGFSGLQNKSLPLKDWLNWPHVQLLTSGQRGYVEEAIEAKQLVRKISVKTQHLTVIPMLLSQSDALFTGPVEPLIALASFFDLQVAAPPIPIADVALSMFEDNSAKLSESAQWFRKMVIENVDQALTQYAPDFA